MESERVARFHRIDWDFQDAHTGALTHDFHPYTAKFIPQIPNRLIQLFSDCGDTVLDPFCGSGTTLLEALLLGRNAIGLDANPIACLISSAKTARLSDDDVHALDRLLQRLQSVDVAAGQPRLLRENGDTTRVPSGDDYDFWFTPQVVSELALLRGEIQSVEFAVARTAALACLSAIIVAVSKQDSETRYTRREKNIKPGDCIARFSRVLQDYLHEAAKLRGAVEEGLDCRVIHTNVLDAPRLPGRVDAVVCSPPYPNAWSYHLYHRLRMLWLDMDEATFKREEIGSHRKYSRKNGADADTFLREMTEVMGWLNECLADDGYACFVIGDSTIRGERVRNDAILDRAASEAGFRKVACAQRNVKSTRKAFNPRIGSIADERILVYGR